ncbi:MAG: hypothetical protein JJ850_10385 [Kordiimonadaceae bacterium]|nr:hypothetical protein [Kordiimonadaceae bacterium]MBO6569542.1 hypothetical protein [Kordiimonadaceae bacterium]MBO6965017.1 hypothetical protein [Kordiimonadaceae bacterium]
MRSKFAAAILLLLSLPLHASEVEYTGAAPESIKIIGLRVPWLLDYEKPGPYNKVADALFSESPLAVHLELQPLKRAMRHFFEGDADCFFMGDTDEAYFIGTPLADTPIIVSEPFNTVNMRVFSFGNTEPFSSVDQITDKRVAVDLGVGGIIRIMQVIPNLTQAVDALNADQIHAMLSKGRAEAALMMDYDYALHAARHPEQALLQFDPALTVQKVQDAMMCKQTPRTETLIAHVNARIAGMSKSGRLVSILRPAVDFAHSHHKPSATAPTYSDY